jgi:glycosyltransferase involved in cell wall biosynthesis
LNQTYPKEKFEIILVDDGSNDDTVAELDKLLRNVKSPAVKIIHNEIKKGPANARNKGILESRGTLVAFTDADCIPNKDWLTELVKGFKDDSIGGVTGKVVTNFERLLYPLRVSPLSEFVTCNIAYTRSVLTQSGFFDERFKCPFREDSDLAYRILDLGYKITHQDSAVVFHPVKQIKLKDLLRVPRYHAYDILLFKKHPKRAKSTVDIRLCRFSTCGVAVILSTLIILSFFIIAPIGWAIICTLVYFFLTTLALSISKPSAKGKNLKEKIQGAIWHELYILFTVVGHVIGSIKFKKWLF